MDNNLIVSNNIINNSLKEYYIQLNKLNQNTSKLMNGILESFKSYSPEVYVTLDDSSENIRIPSFLYLENKIEEIETSFNYLFNLPKNGEAWFTRDNDMYKLNIVHSNIIPPTPSISYDSNNEFMVSQNNFLKDIIFPKTSLRLDIGNIRNNIEKLLIKKIVVLNNSLVSEIFDNNSLNTYNDYKESLYLLKNGVDYEEYDFEMNIPLNKISYNSKFDILEIINGYPKYDEKNNLIYKIRVNTLEYSNVDDSSIVYKLKEGDYLSLSDKYHIFRVTNVNEYIDYDTSANNAEYIIDLQETNGHITLTNVNENETMYFVLYTNELSLENKYINVPLEENQYIVLFVSSIYNNIKSNWSNGIKINLNDVYITDNNTKISYIEYYNKYCKNIGDIINNIANFIYAQPDMYTKEQLKELTTGSIIQQLVTDTLYKDDNQVLTITSINEHLVDDEISNNLARLHKQKIEISNSLSNINNNIDDVFNQLINTDFSVDTSVTQTYLKSKLDSYYAERLTNQQQLISIINNIDLIKNDIIGLDNLKYRVRGITNANDTDEQGMTSNIVTYLRETYGDKCQIIGLEVEYKYKNIRSNSTTIKNNENTVFTDWNRIDNIDKQRYLKFDPITNDYKIEFVNYDNNLNIIKWNQIDIPIQAGEDVILRIRYKYNIGQPFINLYTPWSDNVTVEYSVENSGSITDVMNILEANANDLNNTKFMNELINGGYQEHITNKIIDNSQVYYHMPENIYSGFNTAENKFISLKDKLIDIDKNINEYKEYINDELTHEYKVFLQNNDQMIELTKDTINTINFNTENNYDSYIRKDLNLVIKNTGNVTINFYSIFPGNTDVPLIHSDINHFIYNRDIEDYERVPLLVENILEPMYSVFPQVLGQWIYFRYNNIYTKELLYNISALQNSIDESNINNNKSLEFNMVNNSFIGNNNDQMLLGYRNRISNTSTNAWQLLNINFNTNEITYVNDNTSDNDSGDMWFTKPDEDGNYRSKFVYANSVMKYEHLKYINENQVETYVTANTSLKYEFTQAQNQSMLSSMGFNSIDNIYGMFLIPNLLSKSQIVCDTFKNNQYKKLKVGESISIPILLEYFLNDNEEKNIHKTLAFSLQTSLTKDIDNYLLKIVVSNKLTYTNQSDIYIPLISSESL